MTTHIQWQGTTVCMDMWCPRCESHNHYDAEFAFWVKCSECGQIFRLGTEVSLTPVDEIDGDDACLAESIIW